MLTREAWSADSVPVHSKYVGWGWDQDYSLLKFFQTYVHGPHWQEYDHVGTAFSPTEGKQTSFRVLCFQLCGKTLEKTHIWVWWWGDHKHLSILCRKDAYMSVLQYSIKSLDACMVCCSILMCECERQLSLANSWSYPLCSFLGILQPLA